MNRMTLRAPIPAPDWTLLGSELIRAAFEYARMRLMDKTTLPRGDGHPVVIFPGLAADHRSTGPLKGFCEQLGYAAYDWGRGLNTGPQGDVDAWLDDLASHVSEMTALHRQTISLIGWSLGGIYARELARALPDLVRQVITLGSPFRDLDAVNVPGFLRHRTRRQTAIQDEATVRARLHDLPRCSLPLRPAFRFRGRPAAQERLCWILSTVP
jgi:pimeloyl-ACP methyl ester carboxylesterase